MGYPVAVVDGRGAGYVVWMPAKGLRCRENPDGWSVDVEDKEDAVPLVVYGEDRDRLFTVRLIVILLAVNQGYQRGTSSFD